ncbi:MAG: hypothetical protein IAG10_32315 [Planctomycetaceae bacterium]|nr:hypothetical protein [Planctomycetaceae bacterium]
MLPLARAHLPDLLTAISASQVNTIGAIVTWLVVFEIATYHLLVPIAILGVGVIGATFGISMTILKFFPNVYRPFWEIRKRGQRESAEADPRIPLLISLMKRRLKQAGIPDFMAKQAAIQMGEASEYYKGYPEGRSPEEISALAFTSFVAAVAYWVFSPDLSVIGITSGSAAVLLLVSSASMAFAAYINSWHGQEYAITAALLELTATEDTSSQSSEPVSDKSVNPRGGSGAF